LVLTVQTSRMGRYGRAETLVEFRGALGWINPAGITVCGGVFCAPEPVALVRQRPLTGRLFSVPTYGASQMFPLPARPLRLFSTITRERGVPDTQICSVVRRHCTLPVVSLGVIRRRMVSGTVFGVMTRFHFYYLLTVGG
jgi:hypothetical protein